MQQLRSPIVGREAELAAVKRFTSRLAQGPASLVLEGPAGIGKTAIWNEAVSDAALGGVAVRISQCTETDAAWAFSGLGDLLEGLSGDVLGYLPEIQRRGLDAALLTATSPDRPPGNRVVAVAVLGVLRALSRASPVLLAIDDIQWLDRTTRMVLSFAMRRLKDEPIGLLASCRTVAAEPSAADADLGLAGERLIVGAASVGTLQRMVQQRLGASFSRPTLTRLHQATGGNPMMFLETARAMQRRGSEPNAAEALPVPADLRLLVIERLRDLSPDARQLLLVTAALTQPTEGAVCSTFADAARGRVALDEAFAAGVLEADRERLRFTHPLIASIPYDDLPSEARRALHQMLTRVVTDPEQSARHAALAATQPAAPVAAALDNATLHARRRGSLEKAAELAEMAVQATPPEAAEDLLRRTVVAAEYLFLLGETTQARTLVTRGLQGVTPGPARVPGLLLQATIASWEQGDATVTQWCEQALAEAGGDALLQARCHATFAETSPSGARADLFHAQTAVDLLQGLAFPPPELLSNAFTNLALHGCRLGHGLSTDTLERAIALEESGVRPPVSDRAGMALGICLKVVDRFDESRHWLDTMLASATDEGDDSAMPVTLGHLALLECWAGDYSLAVQRAIDGRDCATRIGVRAPMAASAHVLTLAHLGRLDEARALGVQDLSEDERLGFDSAVALHCRSLGFVELLAGDAAAAAAHFERAIGISRDQLGIGEPAIMRLHADAVAALVAVQRRDDAERLTAELHDSAAANSLPWAKAMAGRCDGLLLAAAGSAAAAVDVLEQALVDHAQLPMPIEEARTRLVLGVALRRAGRRTDARNAFETALSTFVRLQTPVLAGHARAELAALGGKSSSDGQLTAVEERIVAEVAAGRTSQEVADALFLSVRTVDSHLGRVYRKLGLRSRTELARWVAGRSIPDPE